MRQINSRGSRIQWIFIGHSHLYTIQVLSLVVSCGFCNVSTRFQLSCMKVRFNCLVWRLDLDCPLWRLDLNCHPVALSLSTYVAVLRTRYKTIRQGSIALVWQSVASGTISIDYGGNVFVVSALSTQRPTVIVLPWKYLLQTHYNMLIMWMMKELLKDISKRKKWSILYFRKCYSVNAHPSSQWQSH
jgi:hypothetical protein